MDEDIGIETEDRMARMRAVHMMTEAYDLKAISYTGTRWCRMGRCGVGVCSIPCYLKPLHSDLGQVAHP